MRDSSGNRAAIARMRALCGFVGFWCVTAIGQSRGQAVDLETIGRILEEAFQHSQIPEIVKYLTDDLKQSAAVAASLLYDLSMSDRKLPRKPLPPN